MLFTAGCSRVREQITEILWEHSGVPENAEYRQYLELEAAGQLDPGGTYHSDVIEKQLQAEASRPKGAVHVSFARNDYLLINYYLDEDLTVPVTGNSWQLDPGSAVYASAPVLANPNSSLYEFAEFRICEYDSAGKVRNMVSVAPELPGEVFRIPDDFAGTELSIIPLGEYRNRIVTLNAGYYREDGQWTQLENGIWKINDARYGNVTTELNPMGVYRVVYDYSAYKDQWYFVDSSPECYWDKDSDGTVTFFEVPSNEAQVDYKVTFHRYGSMKVMNGVTYQSAVDSILDGASAIFGNRSIIETQNIIDLIQINGISVINQFSDTEITLSDLKVGDEIMIRVPSKLKLIGSGVQVPQPEAKGELLEYRIRIPEADDMSFRLAVGPRNTASDGLFRPYSVNNGTVRVMDSFGIEYTADSELPAENEKITVEIVPDSGYCVYGKNVKDNIYRADMKYSDFISRSPELISSHPIRPGIFVTLDTSDDLGDCVFWSGNNMVSGTVMLREEQDLQFDYTLNVDSGYELILTKEDAAESVGVWSPYSATRSLNVTSDLNGKTLRCRDYLTLKEGVSSGSDPF